VLDGVLRGGTRLNENEVALALGVSRPTVREALRSLVAQGLLEYEPFKGTQVAEISDQTLVQLNDVRVACETVAALSVARRRKEARPTLAAALDAIDAARRLNESGALLDAHFAFHRAIYEHSGNAVLHQIWEVLEVKIRLALVADQTYRPDIDGIAASHRDLLRVVLTGSEAQVREAISRHIVDYADEVVRARSRLKGGPDASAGLAAER
jgi:DNA-binding GntR family transcriptional regulator